MWSLGEATYELEKLERTLGPGEGDAVERSDAQRQAARARALVSHLEWQNLSDRHGRYFSIRHRGSSQPPPRSGGGAPPAAAARLEPIYVPELEAGRLHSGRVLHLRIGASAPPLVAAYRTVYLLADDARCHTVHVAVLNALPQGRGGATPEQQRAAAARAFPAERCLEIREPFCEEARDGQLLVRVDDPAQITMLWNLPRPSADGLREEGSRHFAAGRHLTAAASYTDALMAELEFCGGVESSMGVGRQREPEHAWLLGGLLNNVVNAQLATGAHGAALRYALAAARISGGTPSIAASTQYDLAVALALTPGCAAAAAAALTYALEFNEPPLSDREEVEKEEEFCEDVESLGGSADGVLALLGEPDRIAAAAPRQLRAALASARREVQDGSPEEEGLSAAARRERAAAAQKAGHAAGDMTSALVHYRRGLRALPTQRAATLLSNRAACGLSLGGEAMLHGALLDACAALALAPREVKAHFRRAKALEALGDLPAAVAACQAGLQLCPGGASREGLASLLRELKAAAAAASQRGGRAAAPAGPQRQSGGVAAAAADRSGAAGAEAPPPPPARPSANAAEFTPPPPTWGLKMDARNTDAASDPAHRAQLAADPVGRFTLPDERVPRFHVEYDAAKKWPADCNRWALVDRLLTAYSEARVLPVQGYHMLQPKSTPELLLMMIQSMGVTSSPDNMVLGLLSMMSAPMGTFFEVGFGGYLSTMLHSFGNVAVLPANLVAGGTHVDVGFNDLAGLAEGLLLWERDGRVQLQAGGSANQGEGGSSGAQAAADDVETTGRLLRWVGYEASAYSVAKSLVVGTMAAQGAETDHILQVWYSSVWTDAALQAFRKAVASLLEAPATASPAPSAAVSCPGGLPPAVQTLLRHWLPTTIPLVQARQSWAKRMKTSGAYVANWSREKDRVASAGYWLTGQLLEGDTGSVVMCDVPADAGEIAASEHCLQTIKPARLLRALHQEGSPDLLAAGVAVLRGRVDVLKAALSSGVVTLEFHLQTVTPDDPATLRDISALSPDTMSWSNILDFWKHAEFHRMARACSAPLTEGGRRAPTVHHAYSMAWPRRVRGASVSDLHLHHAMGRQDEAGGSGGGRGAGREREPLTLVQRLTAVLDEGQAAVAAQYRTTGWDRYLLAPPVDNPAEVTGFALHHRHHNAWVEAFRKQGSTPPASLEVVATPEYHPLARTHATLHMLLTYC